MTPDKTKLQRFIRTAEGAAIGRRDLDADFMEALGHRVDRIRWRLWQSGYWVALPRATTSLDDVLRDVLRILPDCIRTASSWTDRNGIPHAQVTLSREGRAIAAQGVHRAEALATALAIARWHLSLLVDQERAAA